MRRGGGAAEGGSSVCPGKSPPPGAQLSGGAVRPRSSGSAHLGTEMRHARFRDVRRVSAKLLIKSAAGTGTGRKKLFDGTEGL